MSAGQRARPLPAPFRHPPGTPLETIERAEQTKVARRRERRTWQPAQAVEASGVTADHWAEDLLEFPVPEIPEWLQDPMAWVVALAMIAVIFVGFGAWPVWSKYREKHVSGQRSPDLYARPVFSTLRSPGAHHFATWRAWSYPHDEVR